MAIGYIPHALEQMRKRRISKTLIEKAVANGQGSMKISYSKKGDILYVQFNAKKVFKTKEIGDDFLIDVDRKGALIGIEVLDYSTQKTKDAFQISAGKEKIAIT